jgi:hypothetical protein
MGWSRKWHTAGLANFNPQKNHIIRKKNSPEGRSRLYIRVYRKRGELINYKTVIYKQ